MPLTFQWVGRNEIDRIAQIRWQCYGSRTGDLPNFRKRTDLGRFADGECCIASRDGVDVGTATALSMHMHVRGRRLPCQGVAWVGTSKSDRRRGKDERGIASQVMEQLMRRARERGEVISPLMPFRASFYEHFGFGVMESQHIWTVPLSILPTDESSRWRFGTPADAPAMLACRARQSAAGQCDVETSDRALNEWMSGLYDDTQLFVDDRGGRIVAYTWVRTLTENDKGVAFVQQPAWESLDGLRSVLGLLASFRDQYSFGRITLPTDLPLNWLLRERQVPHRAVDHPTAQCRVITRMQSRIIDHAAFLSGQTVAPWARGELVVRIRECDREPSTVAVRFENGRIDAEPVSRSPDLELADTTWAAIACGHQRATTLVRLSLVDVNRPEAAALLDALFDGPAPFSHEYF